MRLIRLHLHIDVDGYREKAEVTIKDGIPHHIPPPSCAKLLFQDSGGILGLSYGNICEG